MEKHQDFEVKISHESVRSRWKACVMGFSTSVLRKLSTWAGTTGYDFEDDYDDSEELWRKPSLAAPVKNWKSLPGREKVKLIKARPLPFVAGHVIFAERNTKRYELRVTPPADGVLGFNRELAIEVVVIAGSKQEALDAVSTAIAGRTWNDAAENGNIAECGGWYAGNHCLLEILSHGRNTDR